MTAMSWEGMDRCIFAACDCQMAFYRVAACLDAGSLQNPRWTGPRAKQYPFVLDPFQEVSIACIVRFSRQHKPSLTDLALMG